MHAPLIRQEKNTRPLLKFYLMTIMIEVAIAYYLLMDNGSGSAKGKVEKNTLFLSLSAYLTTRCYSLPAFLYVVCMRHAHFELNTYIEKESSVRL